MEEYQTYIKHKSLERITGTILLIFAIVGIFVVGSTLETKQLYGQINNVTLVENK